MIVEQTLSEKQQRTSNILAAGNLWYGRKSAVALEKMNEVHTQTVQQTKITNAKLTDISNNIEQLSQIASEQIRIQKINAARQEQRYAEEDARRIEKENKEQENAFRKDAFFHLDKELTELDKSKISNLEKYFSVMSINSMIAKYKINTSLTNELKEKKLISDTLDKIADIEKNILNNFKDQDYSDLEVIFEVMEEDEEVEITRLKAERLGIEGIDKEIEEIKKSNEFSKIIKKYQNIVENILNI
jgi:hypothetical protein